MPITGHRGAGMGKGVRSGPRGVLIVRGGLSNHVTF